MERGSHVILKNYSGELKFLNNSVATVIDITYENRKLSKIKMVFDKPVYQLKPVKAEILVWAADEAHVMEFCRTPIKVGRISIKLTRLPITKEVNNEKN